ncbi:MAG: glutamine--fructose-6-phosphate transaminase (isomerizing) [Candidatus Omnitrophica bacterium]|nr:glutamine--fructose-6-phosphate transaminase (isomerizing) [Candidatus Omnitrophota bacterium]
MCGIFGYIGDKNCVPILIGGLKKLEYRGYDSAGICVADGCRLTVVKKRGKIADLEGSLRLKKIIGTIGIAHTRWATHGEPNEVNAHPHTDCCGKIAIVHNGIIENYAPLKKLLEQEGHKIVSQTDSEVLAHLIEKFYAGDLEKAVIQALKIVDGAFGLAALHENEDRIVVARRGSPLIVGIGKNEMLISSDAAALLNHTKKAVYMADNEVASVTKNGYIIKHLNGGRLAAKKVDKIKWAAAQVEKGDFAHFMLKEIYEQPETIENALRGRIKHGRIKLSIELNVSTVRRIIITACGTSWHSALLGKYIIESLASIPVEVDYASEFRYRSPLIKRDDLVVAISQSGETADTLGAIREAKEKFAKTLGIINTVGSSIARDVDSGIYLHAGPEIGVASTKAFTSQVAVLILFALYLRQARGGALDKNIIGELCGVPQKIRHILENTSGIKSIAQRFKNSPNFLYLGRGVNFPVALEGALKLKEVSYIHAEGYPAAEMKHGPIALIDKKMPVVFLATEDRFLNKILSNIHEVKARGGIIIAVANGNGSKKVRRLAEHIITVPSTLKSELSPIINVIPLQLIAYYIANAKGINMDKPRNLAKSVTVE